jgi:Transposase, Mutator family
VKQRAGKTTPTDSRSRRIRASRRGGQVLTRARSPSNETGLPVHVCLKVPLSRTVAPYSPPQTHTGPPGQSLRTRRHPAPFIPDTNLLERSLGEVKRRTKVMGRFPGETSCLTLVWAVLDLLITHQTNGIHFNQLDRQRLKRMQYEGAEQTIPEEVTAA